MLIIKSLVKTMKATMHDADEYASKACGFKMDHPETAALYARLSNDHLDELQLLHQEVERHIRHYEREGRQVPAGMMEIWEFEHQELMDDAHGVRMRLEAMRK